MSQQKSPHEDMLMFVGAFIVIFGGGWIIWSAFSVQLTSALRWIRVGELYLVGWVLGDDYSIDFPGYGPQVVEMWRKWLIKVDASAIKPLDLEIVTTLVVPALKIPFMIVLIAFSFFVTFGGPGTSYRRRMNLQALMQEQAKSFPTIAPFIKFDPRKLPIRAPGQAVPINLPLFAEALSPEEWLALHSIKVSGGTIDAMAAHQALTKQLGKRWQGPLQLPLHMQGIYAVCALKHVRKRKDSDEMLNQLALAWSPEKGFKPNAKLVSWIRKVIKDPKLGGNLQKFADQHAYETTAMLRCLARAREEGGVLAPATFVWLRGHDRNLWYPLNNLGRKSYHAEAAGAMVHYTNELIAGQKIPTPRFDEVLRGLETYMKSGAARALPEVDTKAGVFKYWKKK